MGGNRAYMNLELLLFLDSSQPRPTPPPPHWPLLPSSFPGEGQIRRQCHIQIKQQAYYEQKVMLATYMRRMRKTTWRL